MYRKACTVVQSTSDILMLYYGTVYSIESSCLFFFDFITSFGFRIDIKLLQEILFFFFTFLDKVLSIRDALHRVKWMSSIMQFFFYKFEFEFRYLKDWLCSLYLFWNNLPVCPVYFLPQYGQMSWYIPQLLSLPISPMFCMPRFSLCY